MLGPPGIFSKRLSTVVALNVVVLLLNATRKTPPRVYMVLFSGSTDFWTIYSVAVTILFWRFGTHSLDRCWVLRLNFHSSGKNRHLFGVRIKNLFLKTLSAETQAAVTKGPRSNDSVYINAAFDVFYYCSKPAISLKTSVCRYIHYPRHGRKIYCRRSVTLARLFYRRRHEIDRRAELACEQKKHFENITDQ